ncbi:MAG: hypothetical protein AB8G05_17870 [Oligoflexales bacterium]
MNKVYLFQLGGFFISSMMQIILVYLAACLSIKNWVYIYCTLILGISSLLCFKGFMGILYLEHFILLFMGLALVYAQRKRRVSFLSFIKFSEFKGPVFFALFAGLCLEQLYAGLPVYRPDLWDYHLTISKIVSNSGKLLAPIFNDHIYFS